jgi:hypothetical protein
MPKARPCRQSTKTRRVLHRWVPQPIVFVPSNSDTCTSRDFDTVSVGTIRQRQNGPGWGGRGARTIDDLPNTKVVGFGVFMNRSTKFSYAEQFGGQFLCCIHRHFHSPPKVRRTTSKLWGCYCHRRRHQLTHSVLVACAMIFYFVRLSSHYIPLPVLWEQLQPLIPPDYHAHWPTLASMATHTKCRQVIELIQNAGTDVVSTRLPVTRGVGAWWCYIRDSQLVPQPTQQRHLRNRLKYYSRHWHRLQQLPAWQTEIAEHTHKWRHRSDLRYFQRQWLLSIFMCLLLVATETRTDTGTEIETDTGTGTETSTETGTGTEVPQIDPGEAVTQRPGHSDHFWVHLLLDLLNRCHQRQFCYLLCQLYRNLNELGPELGRVHQIDMGRMLYLRRTNRS